MSYERKLAPDQPAANDPEYVVIGLRTRLARLEAANGKLTANLAGEREEARRLLADVRVWKRNAMESRRRAEQSEADLVAMQVEFEILDAKYVLVLAELRAMKARHCELCAHTWSDGDA